MKAEAEDVCLIDFASFEANTPFFYDHAYFELSTLLRTFAGLAPQRWLDLCLSLLPGQEDAIDALDQGERAWAKDIFTARKDIVASALLAFPDRADDLRVQSLVAEVAAGLAFLNKVPRQQTGSAGLTAEQYQQAFVWAAVATASVLSACAITPPGEAISIPTVGPKRLIAEQIDEPDWVAVSGYDHPGLNILVLAPDVRAGAIDPLRTLFRVRWNLVLDFSTEPLPDPSSALGPLPIRSSWLGGETPAPGLIEHGVSWFFVNGRSDLAGCAPATSYVAWRRRYRRWIEDILVDVSEAVGPPSVRVLFFGSRIDLESLKSVAEALDTAFADALAPMLVALDNPILLADGNKIIARPSAVLSRLAVNVSASQPSASSTASPLLPRRTTDGQFGLSELPRDLALRVARDLTVVHRGLSGSTPSGRIFGLDFRRGAVAEWAELAARLDVRRDAFDDHRKELRKLLGASTNATHNLLHQPSAGGSTLSRRLAWSLMDEFPTVVVTQLTNDTSSYLRDLFQFTGLPLLILLESTVVTESARQGLLQQLREDNTRGVFLWVARVYRKSAHGDVLGAALSDTEATRFLQIYQEQATELERREELARLVYAPEYRDQRSPFFFGLVAFGDKYLGIDRLISETLSPLSDVGKALLTDLCLLTAYTSDGYPAGDFDDLCSQLNKSERPFHPMSPLVYEQAAHLRVSHTVLAREVLRRVARTDAWQTDLGRFSEQFLSHVLRLRHTSSLRIRALVESLFVTRDTRAVLQTDSDAFAGGIPLQSRFAPLIEAMGNRTQARYVLRLLTERWPQEAHFGVHYSRHLLYEPPAEIDKGIQVMESANRLPGSEADDVVVHMLGMCYRARMQERLDDAVREKAALAEVETAIRGDFELAMRHFDRAIQLNPLNEHGRVASIQTVQRLLTRAMEVARVKSLQGLLGQSAASPWCIEALSRAEEHVALLRERPTFAISGRSQKAIAEWDLVYGDVDAVIVKLRNLSKRHEDVWIRRALYHAILTKHDRRWGSIPKADLVTVEDLTRRNVESQGIRDADVRAWLMAVRHLATFDLDVVIRRLTDWHEMRPASIEAPFYCYVFRFLQWLNREPRNKGYAEESKRWLRVCRGQRQIGERNWGYEWLTPGEGGYGTVHFTELGFDPVHAIRTGDEESARKLSRRLGRVTATLVAYSGPQHATLDLGHGLTMHITPLDRLVRDHVGRRVSAFLSFGYDGPVGWDARLADDKA